MTITNPEVLNIFKKLVSNENLIKFLTEVGVLMTTEDFYNIFSFKTKRDPKEYTKDYNGGIFKKMADILYENAETIKNNSISQLVKQHVAYDDLIAALELDEKNTSENSFIFRELFYIYKTSYADNFFQNNWKKLIPIVDSEELENNEIATGFLDAMAKEFDKLNEIISDNAIWKSYEDIPKKYINYLTQLLGFESSTFSMPDNNYEEFKILAANIVDVYKSKGTIDILKLLFNFLGYNIYIKEMYFDRRMYYAFNDENTETNTLNKNDFRFYLTKNNPILNKGENFSVNEIVYDKDCVEKLSLDDFNELAEKYSAECVLGYEDYYKCKKTTWINGEYYQAGKYYLYTGDIYKYFKTNYVIIQPSPFGKNANFTVEQNIMVEKILDFFIPYFWKRDVIISPFTNAGAEAGEKMTLNGHRGQHKEDDIVVNDEGFRFLDSETWIYRDETEEPSYKEEERLSETKQDFLLESENIEVNDYVFLKDDTVVLSKDEYNALNNKAKEKYKMVNDNLYIKSTLYDDENKLNNIYRNSLGERLGSRPYSQSGEKTNHNVVMEPIGRKNIFINSTRGWGKSKEPKTLKKDSVYPIWSSDYIPIMEGTKQSYFTPGRSSESRLYIPAFNDYDINNQWSKMSLVNLFGLEGESLKRSFLEDNIVRPVKFAVDNINSLKDILSEKKLKKVSNFYFKYVRSISINNNGSSEFTLDNFVKQYNVINYDYINNELLKCDINDLKIVDNKYSGGYLANIFNNIYNENVYCLSTNKNKDSNVLDVYRLKIEKNSEYNRFEFFKSTNKNISRLKFSSFEDLEYPEINTESSSKIYIMNGEIRFKTGNEYEVLKEGDVISHIVGEELIGNYVARRRPTNKKSIIKGAGKTDIKTFVFESDLEELIKENKNKEIEEIKSKADIILSDNSTELEIGTMLYNIIDKQLYQMTYNSIEPGDLIYLKEEEKIYETMFNSFVDLSNDNIETLKLSKVDYRQDTESDKNYGRLFDNCYTDNTTTRLFFGLKEYDLKGRLEYNENEDRYEIKKYDKDYKGISEEDDNDNYILNNNERVASWKVLDGLSIDYLKDGYIKRPSKLNTDKLFERIVSTEENLLDSDTHLFLTNLFKELILPTDLSEKEIVNTEV